MGKFFKFILISIIIVSLSFGIYKFSNRYNINLIYNNIDWTINTKSCEKAVAFDFDEEDNLYIAFKDYIKVIRSNDKEEILMKEENFDIYDITCYENNIIIATDNRILKYNLESNKYDEIIVDMPNRGLNKETKIIVNEGKLYVTIGANTNSGVVDSKDDAVDIPSFEWIYTGASFGEKKTSAFSEFGKVLTDGEKIKEGTLSNASIIKYDLNTGETTTYATGIRNVKGFSFDSKNNMIAILGGIENIGVRPVLDDCDYIYDIREKAWYGWPDFSGGDPITSPRFADENTKNTFVIKNHPTEVPFGPKYQHDTVGSLNGLTVDNDGKCFLKDTIVFGDNNKKTIYSLSKDGFIRKIIDLDKNSKVEKIKYYNSSIYILDSEIGCLYKIEGRNGEGKFTLPKFAWIFLMIFIIVIMLCVVYKFKKKYMYNK